MSTVDDAVEAGARALEAMYGSPPGNQMDMVNAEAVLRAAWPVLSAGLRAKAELHTIGAHIRGSEDERHWLDLIHLIDRIDKEWGYE